MVKRKIRTVKQVKQLGPDHKIEKERKMLREDRRLAGKSQLSGAVETLVSAINAFGVTGREAARSIARMQLPAFNPPAPRYPTLQRLLDATGYTQIPVTNGSAHTATRAIDFSPGGSIPELQATIVGLDVSEQPDVSVITHGRVHDSIIIDSVSDFEALETRLVAQLYGAISSSGTLNRRMNELSISFDIETAMLSAEIDEYAQRVVRAEINAGEEHSIVNGKEVLNDAVKRDPRQRELPHARFLAENQNFRSKSKRR